MENLDHKPGRRQGCKNVNNRPIPDQVTRAFQDVSKTLKEDLALLTPSERVNATIQLAGYLLVASTDKKNTNEKFSNRPN